MHPHRKRVRHYHEPGDVHELTFSCYRRMALLTNDRWREHLSRALDDAVEAEGFGLVAFVFMPEHVHLIVATPVVPEPPIDRLLGRLKRATSVAVKADLEASSSRLLESLTVRERPGRFVFRFWQEGPGYDRNLDRETTVLTAIDYVHLNPVRRGLCEKAADWRWSSARWYVSDGDELDPALPTIHGLPADFFGVTN